MQVDASPRSLEADPEKSAPGVDGFHVHVRKFEKGSRPRDHSYWQRQPARLHRRDRSVEVGELPLRVLTHGGRVRKVKMCIGADDA